MMIYFAGAGGVPEMKDKPKLESFWYKNDAMKAMQTDAPFFLDSGAFTAFTKNVTIRPEDYADFIKRNKEHITTASSLDAIGDAAKSLELFNLLREMGCDVIPVFHCREDFDYLTRYLDMGCDYLALGGMVPETKPWLKRWLDIVWGDYLTNKDGSARVKVHGFGMTILDFMLAYPWYSVDSSSWTYGARFSYGLIQYPNGKYTWTYFGQNHSSRKNWNGKNYWTFSPLLQETVRKFIESMGYAIEDMADAYKLNLFNAAVFDSWQRHDLSTAFINHDKGLF